ncbi:MAG: hypothetical protein GY927_11835 [bacterium]|nr:hypothetical protein [bacterium]
MSRAWRLMMIAVASLPGLESSGARGQDVAVQDFQTFIVDSSKHRISLHWKDQLDQPYRSLSAVQSVLRGQGKMVLALMNAGIYDKERRPLGLHVEEGRVLRPLDRRRGGGNFYLKPNGVFYIATSGAAIARTKDFKFTKDIKLATQSGPLLFDKNGFHPAFVKNSKHKHYRNAIGVHKDGHVVFLMSTKPVTFWQLAHYLRDQQKCIAGLYLDGYISQFWQTGQKGPASAKRFVGILAVSELDK